MLWFLLLQSTPTTCMLNGQFVTCTTPGAVRTSQPVDLTPLTRAPADFADAVAEGRCRKMAERASKAGDHDAAAKILANCQAK